MAAFIAACGGSSSGSMGTAGTSSRSKGGSGRDLKTLIDTAITAEAPAVTSGAGCSALAHRCFGFSRPDALWPLFTFS